MIRTKPPFRADQVGSLLRPEPVKTARARRAAGELSDADLRRIEDREIERLITKQEELGLMAVTDGECRRGLWHYDFFAALDGVELKKDEAGVEFQGARVTHAGPVISGTVGFSGHPMLDHFAFLKAHTSVLPKMCIPSPSVLHYRQDETARRAVYPHLDDFFADLAAAYADAIEAFYDAGCRYLQLDDTVWAYLCSPDEAEKARARGLEIDGLQERYRDTINQALAAKPTDMTVTMHVCRGNFRSTWITEGGYEPVAEIMLKDLALDGYFLEYDSDRAGGFEPLRFLPEGDKIVVLGLITSKFGELEAIDAVEARIREAAQFVALEQLCLSPQCGFASTEEGNVISEDEQWAKLGRVVAIAHDVWDG